MGQTSVNTGVPGSDDREKTAELLSQHSPGHGTAPVAGSIVCTAVNVVLNRSPGSILSSRVNTQNLGESTNVPIDLACNHSATTQRHLVEPSTSGKHSHSNEHTDACLGLPKISTFTYNTKHSDTIQASDNLFPSSSATYILPPPPILSTCNSRWQRPLFVGDEYGQPNNQFEDFPLKPSSCHARQSATLPSASKFSPILSNLGRPKNYSPTLGRSDKASGPMKPSNQYVYGK
ncbi:hypothetical protein AHF37_02040 [Paragonimus kellicotti]|nr:hypothetical protein AHF37_02040 [Paragonimus kellicotti]